LFISSLAMFTSASLLFHCSGVIVFFAALCMGAKARYTLQDEGNDHATTIHIHLHAPCSRWCPQASEDKVGMAKPGQYAAQADQRYDHLSRSCMATIVYSVHAVAHAHSL
jgi:hypothetical protein